MEELRLPHDELPNKKVLVCNFQLANVCGEERREFVLDYAQEQFNYEEDHSTDEESVADITPDETKLDEQALAKKVQKKISKMCPPLKTGYYLDESARAAMDDGDDDGMLD